MKLKQKHLACTEKVLAFFAIVGVAVANYFVFMLVPNERVMGAVQRVFYFHVGAAIACYTAAGIMLICSLVYLSQRDKRADIISESAAEVGFVFCSIVLFSGMIWGHAAWNTWFRWEPRLVAFLLLWFIFLALTLLRKFGDPRQLPNHCAILSVVGAINVPLVVFSVKLLPQAAQLHPQVIENRGLKDWRFVVALIISIVALVALQLWLVWLRSRIGFLKEKICR